MRDLLPSKAYLNFSLNRLERYLGNSFFLSRPPVLQLELTNSCNLSCNSCGHSHWDETKNRATFFDFERLNDLRPLLYYASEIQLGGYGEPTLHPRFLDIVRWFRSEYANLFLRLISNGTRTEELKQALPSLSRVIVSIDGSADIYRKNRRIAIDRILPSLALFADSEVELEVNLVWNRETHADLPRFLEFLEQYPVRALHLLPEKMYGKSRLRFSLFQPQNLHQLNLDLHRLKASTSVPIQHPDLLTYPLPCNQPLDSVFVLADGEVMACCASIFKGNPHRFSLGSMPAMSWRWFWLLNQKRLRSFRKARFQHADFESPCDTCGFRMVTEEYLVRDTRV